MGSGPPAESVGAAPPARMPAEVLHAETKKSKKKKRQESGRKDFNEDDPFVDALTARQAALVTPSAEAKDELLRAKERLRELGMSPSEL